jgi:hypothetical protein
MDYKRILENVLREVALEEGYMFTQEIVQSACVDEGNGIEDHIMKIFEDHIMKIFEDSVE